MPPFKSSKSQGGRSGVWVGARTGSIEVAPTLSIYLSLDLSVSVSLSFFLSIYLSCIYRSMHIYLHIIYICIHILRNMLLTEALRFCVAAGEGQVADERRCSPTVADEHRCSPSVAERPCSLHVAVQRRLGSSQHEARRASSPLQVFETTSFSQNVLTNYFECIY